MERMRVAIIGSTLNTYYGIEEIAKHHDILALSTLSPKKAFRKSRSTIFDDQAKRYGFQRFYDEDKLKDPEVIRRFEDLRLDLIVELGSSMWVPEEILRSARYGCIGSHGAKLPHIRGGASMNWAMITGETDWGVSLFYLTPVTDEGITIATQDFKIEERDNINTVTYKSDLATVKMLRYFSENFRPKEEFETERLEEVHINPSQKDASSREVIEWGRNVKKQYEEYKERDFPGKAVFLPQRKLQDGLMDWDQSSQDAHNFVRALTGPYFPGAFTFYKRKKLFLLESESIRLNEDVKPGQVMSAINYGLVVGTKDSQLKLKRVRLENMPEMWGDELSYEIGIKPGDQFGF